LPPSTPRRSQALEAELLRDAACQGEDAEVVAHPFLLLRAVLPPADTVSDRVEKAGVQSHGKGGEFASTLTAPTLDLGDLELGALEFGA